MQRLHHNWPTAITAPIAAWWFEPENGKLRYGDNRRPMRNRTHKLLRQDRKRPISLCDNGFHASRRFIDACYYARSNIIWRVTLQGEGVECRNDKIAASERTYIERLDISQMLETHLLDVMEARIQRNTPKAIKDYLKTRDRNLMPAAHVAASDLLFKNAPGCSDFYSLRAMYRDALEYPVTLPRLVHRETEIEDTKKANATNRKLETQILKAMCLK